MFMVETGGAVGHRPCGGKGGLHRVRVPAGVHAGRSHTAGECTWGVALLSAFLKAANTTSQTDCIDMFT